eukprot:gene11295-11381_t
MKNPLPIKFALSLLASAIILVAAGCKKSSSSTSGITIPIVVTNGSAINVTATTAQSGGIINNFGNDVITEDGVCYSATNSTPTVSDGKAKATLVSGNILYPPFTSNITGLTANTTYYLRAYATNSAGTGYGGVVKFTTGSNTSVIAGQVTTFAGNGTAGSLDGSGTSAQFNNPQGVAVDAKGNIYVADSYNHTIREITPGGTVTTIAGTPQTLGYIDGPALSAQFYAPKGMAFDAQGNLYVADYGNNVIRKISTAGVVSTYSGNATAGYVDGSTASTIEYNGPAGIAFDSQGNLYVADRGNHVIRKITPAGVVSTLAGTNNGLKTPGYVNATDLLAAFNKPNSVVVDLKNNVDVADQSNAAIRQITISGGVTTTLAGGPSQSDLLNLPTALAIDASGNLYIVDEGGRILEYTPNNNINILAGNSNVSGFVNGYGTAAQFSNPQGIAIDANGNIYVADQGNNCIRKIVITAAAQ